MQLTIGDWNETYANALAGALTTTAMTMKKTTAMAALMTVAAVAIAMAMAMVIDANGRNGKRGQVVSIAEVWA